MQETEPTTKPLRNQTKGKPRKGSAGDDAVSWLPLGLDRLFGIYRRRLRCEISGKQPSLP